MKELLNVYSQEEINEAFQKLGRLSKDIINKNTNCKLGIVNNKYNDEIWERRSFKRSHITDVEIKNSAFVNCAFVGSIFQNVKFLDTVVKGSNLTFCIFNNCEFSFTEKMTAYEGSNFGSSQFINCKFINLVFQSSTLSESQFINCTFEKCEFNSDTLENTVFDCCNLMHVNMRSLNLEFSIFKNCKIKHVSFPFLQFPYVIGAKEILSLYGEESKTNDLIFCINGQEVGLQEYLDLLPSLSIYYKQKNELFPFTNIMLIQDKEEQAIESLIEGIQISLQDKDFRLIEYYCRLGKHYAIIDIHLAQDILHSIDDKIITLNEENDNSYNNNGLISSTAASAGIIRNILLYDMSNKHQLQFELETKIPIENSKKINALQNSIQYVIDEYSTDKSQQFIEIRHGSPATFIVQFMVEHPLIIAQVSYALMRVVSSFGKKLIRKWNIRRDGDFIIKELKAKYGNDVDMHGPEFIDLLKSEIKNIMLETRDNLVEKKRGSVNKHFDAITQRIFDTIDNRLQPVKSCLILTTRRADSLISD